MATTANRGTALTVGEKAAGLFAAGYRVISHSAGLFGLRTPENTIYYVNPNSNGCTCAAGVKGTPCKHIAGIQGLIFAQSQALLAAAHELQAKYLPLLDKADREWVRMGGAAPVRIGGEGVAAVKTAQEMITRAYKMVAAAADIVLPATPAAQRLKVETPAKIERGPRMTDAQFQAAGYTKTRVGYIAPRVETDRRIEVSAKYAAYCKRVETEDQAAKYEFCGEAC